MDQNITNNGKDEFVNYYEKQSVTSETINRSVGIFDAVTRTLQKMKLPSTMVNIADIGCNAGTQGTMWAEKGYKVHGIDINEKLIEIARKRAKDKNLGIEFIVGSADNLPWDDASMDVCLVPELLEHVEDWKACVKEFDRILKPNGLLYISTTNKLCPKQQEFDLPLYSWYPRFLKKYYEKISVTTRPELVSHAKYPAVHWFSYYGFRKYMGARNFDTYDRFDIMNLEDKGKMIGLVVTILKKIPPLRLLGHIATPSTTIICIKKTPD